MIIPILALPGPRVDEIMREVQATLRQRGFETDVFNVDSEWSFTHAVLSSRAPYIICCFTMLVDGLADCAMDPDRPWIYLYSDPLEVVRRVVEEGVDAVDATRQTMRRLATFVSVSSGPNCVIVDADDRLPADCLLQAIEQRLGLRPRHREASGSTAMTSFTPEAPDDETGIMWRGALGPFQDRGAYQPPSRFVVSRLLFNDHTHSGAKVRGAIDITGRSQLLVFGPYVYIPRGTWQTRLVLSFSPEVAGAQVLVDVAVAYGRDVKVRNSFTVNVAGRHEVLLDFVHEQPGEPIEFRIWSERAIFDGKMAIGFAEVQQRENLVSADMDSTHELIREQVR